MYLLPKKDTIMLLNHSFLHINHTFVVYIMRNCNAWVWIPYYYSSTGAFSDVRLWATHFGVAFL